MWTLVSVREKQAGQPCAPLDCHSLDSRNEKTNKRQTRSDPSACLPEFPTLEHSTLAQAGPGTRIRAPQGSECDCCKARPWDWRSGILILPDGKDANRQAQFSVRGMSLRLIGHHRPFLQGH